MTQITDDGGQAFTPYTAEKVDPLVDLAIAHLGARLSNSCHSKEPGRRLLQSLGGPTRSSVIWAYCGWSGITKCYRLLLWN